MESNRSPFDFAEGESELVSGFNTEYRSGGFAVIFMAEYLRILFLRIIRASIVNRGRGFWLFFIMLVNRFI
jgi:NADH:ubiquinone oxidoreductase subunit H